MYTGGIIVIGKTKLDNRASEKLKKSQSRTFFLFSLGVFHNIADPILRFYKQVFIYGIVTLSKTKVIKIKIKYYLRV